MAPVGLIISGMTPTMPNTRSFQGELPDSFAFAVPPSIYSIWVLHGPDNATLNDVSVTREALYPEKTRDTNSLCSNPQQLLHSSAPRQDFLQLCHPASCWLNLFVEAFFHGGNSTSSPASLLQ